MHQYPSVPIWILVQKPINILLWENFWCFKVIETLLLYGFGNGSLLIRIIPPLAALTPFSLPIMPHTQDKWNKKHTSGRNVWSSIQWRIVICWSSCYTKLDCMIAFWEYRPLRYLARVVLNVFSSQNILIYFSYPVQNKRLSMWNLITFICYITSK